MVTQLCNLSCGLFLAPEGDHAGCVCLYMTSVICRTSVFLTWFRSRVGRGMACARWVDESGARSSCEDGLCVPSSGSSWSRAWSPRAAPWDCQWRHEIGADCGSASLDGRPPKRGSVQGKMQKLPTIVGSGTSRGGVRECVDDAEERVDVATQGGI